MSLSPTTLVHRAEMALEHALVYMGIVAVFSIVRGYQVRREQAQVFALALGNRFHWTQAPGLWITFEANYQGHWLVARCRRQKETGLGTDYNISHHFDLSVLPPSAYRYNIYLAPQGILDRFSSNPEIEVGHPDFDHRIRVTGDHEAGVVSLLSDRARELILAISAIADGFEVNAKGMKATLKTDSSSYRVSILLEKLVELSEHFIRGTSMQDRLTENVLTSKEMAVRQRNLALLRRYPISSELTGRLGQHLLNLPLGDEAARGAVMVGGEALAEYVGRLKASRHPFRQEVIAALSESTDPVVLPVLNVALFQRASAVPALEGLLRQGDLSFLPRARELVRLSRTMQESSTIRIIDLLGACRKPELEPVLLEHFREVLESSTLLPSVVQALGNCGTTASVMPLKPVAEGLIPSEARRLAREAIAAIQSRVTPGAAGGLMLTQQAAQAGGLSVADTRMEGALTIRDSDGTGQASTSTQTQQQNVQPTTVKGEQGPRRPLKRQQEGPEL